MLEVPPAEARKLRSTARLIVAHDLLQSAFSKLLSGLVFRFSDAICAEKKPVTGRKREIAHRVFRYSVDTEG